MYDQYEGWTSIYIDKFMYGTFNDESFMPPPFCKWFPLCQRLKLKIDKPFGQIVDDSLEYEWLIFVIWVFNNASQEYDTKFCKYWEREKNNICWVLKEGIPFYCYQKNSNNTRILRFLLQNSNHNHVYFCTRNVYTFKVHYAGCFNWAYTISWHGLLEAFQIRLLTN